MTRPPLRRPLLATLVAATLALAGCTSSAGSDPSAGSAGDELGGELTIFAAASLSGAFDELAAQFGAQHPDLDVLPVTYDGSSVLATQLIEGASADVFASADENNMAAVDEAGLATEVRPFATNTMQIAVSPGNPKGIDGLASLADPGLIVVTCAAEVPCGSAAHTLLDAAGVALKPASEEQNVTAVLAKVKSGEADAGLVYRTDVAAAENTVTGVDIDGADEATNVYPLTTLAGAGNENAASAFVAFVLSDEGQAVLHDFGFGAP